MDKSAAFNAVYRNTWKAYYDLRTHAEIENKLERLTAGLDAASVDICRHQTEIAPYFFPHALLHHAQLPEAARPKILPQSARSALTALGYYDRQEERLHEIQAKWGLAEAPLPEILTHSGLKYLDAPALARIRGSSAIDGGAYIGDTARIFIDHYGAGRVYALEPELRNFAALNANIKKWRLADRIVSDPIALSDEEQNVALWGQGMGASMLGKAGVVAADAETCAGTTIDHYVASRAIGNIGLIKLDVEGAEQKAIRGGMKTIREHRPVLIISIYHTADDFFEIKPMLESMNLGYAFSIRRITDDFIKEFVLLAWREA